MKPFITVAIPVYNGAKFIVECLESIKGQSALELCEILIVDDQSKDDSIDIIQEYLKRNHLDCKWRIERNQSNLGLVGNWNRCLQLANAEWIMFLFQDDFLEPDAIVHRIKLVESTTLPLVISDRNYVYEEGVNEYLKVFYDTKLKRLSDYYSKPVELDKASVANLALENFLGQNFIGEPVVGVIKKDLFKKYGYFDSDLKQICDLEIWLRIGLNEGLFFDPKRIVNFRVHGNSTSRRNSLNKVTVSRVDRVQLGFKLLTKDYYSQFRSWYTAQGFVQSLDQRYKNWCFKNLPLNRHFFLYKRLIDNSKFRMDIRFVFTKLKAKLISLKK